MRDKEIQTRPWGRWSVEDVTKYENLVFKTKLIYVYPNKKLSFQRHKYRREVWTVLKGTAIVFNDDKHYILKKNETTFIETGSWHQLINNTDTLLLVHEVQIGEICEEDDIERKTI